MLRTEGPLYGYPASGTGEVRDRTASSEIAKAAVTGKAIDIDKGTHTESIVLEKSNIETWKFIIKTK